MGSHRACHSASMLHEKSYWVTSSWNQVSVAVCARTYTPTPQRSLAVSQWQPCSQSRQPKMCHCSGPHCSQAVIAAIEGSAYFVLPWFKEWRCLETNAFCQHPLTVEPRGVSWRNNGIHATGGCLYYQTVLRLCYSPSWSCFLASLISAKPVLPKSHL